MSSATQARRSFNANSPYRLTVEGSDDKHAIIGLLQVRGFDWGSNSSTVPVPFVQDAGGVDEALSAVAPGHKNYKIFGLVLDADESPMERWKAVADRLIQFGYAPPSKPPQSGYIQAGPSPQLARIGVWLMPDNQHEGALEEFLTQLVPSDDPTWKYADECVTGALALRAPLRPADQLKARLHTWSAWRERPGMPYGLLLRSQQLLATSSAADAFERWFRDLFYG